MCTLSMISIANSQSYPAEKLISGAVSLAPFHPFCSSLSCRYISICVLKTQAEYRFCVLSVPSLLSNQIVKREGYLFKKGALEDKQFHKRYFRLLRNGSVTFLGYYKDSTPNGTVLGTIHLNGAKLIEGKKTLEFTLSTCDKAIFCLLSEDERDKKLWMQDIQACIGHEAKVIYEGWLQKRGRLNKGFKIRYFRLTCKGHNHDESPFTLMYFKNDEVGNPYGAIDLPKIPAEKLSGIMQVVGGTTFSLFDGSRKYVLRAGDKKQMEAWMKILSEILIVKTTKKVEVEKSFSQNLTAEELKKFRNLTRKGFMNLSFEEVNRWLHFVKTEFKLHCEEIEAITDQEYDGKSLLMATEKELYGVLKQKVGRVRRIQAALKRFQKRKSFETSVKTERYLGKVRIFHPAEVKKGRLLGNGAFGEAYLAQLNNEGVTQLVCLKIPFKASEGLDSETLRELAAMAAIKPHTNVIHFKGMVTMGNKICFMTEYCQLGSLDKLHNRMDLVQPKIFLKIARDVASGLAHLHADNIIHRDLACRNLLMRNDKSVVISDYGLSRKLPEEQMVYRIRSQIPWKWAAPEVLSKKTFRTKADIWSLGVALWEILHSGESPYDSEKGRLLQEDILGGIITGEITLKVPSQTPALPKLIVECCLQHDPILRPSAIRLCERITCAINSGRWEDFLQGTGTKNVEFATESSSTTTESSDEGSRAPRTKSEPLVSNRKSVIKASRSITNSGNTVTRVRHSTREAQYSYANFGDVNASGSDQYDDVEVFDEKRTGTRKSTIRSLDPTPDGKIRSSVAGSPVDLPATKAMFSPSLRDVSKTGISRGSQFAV
ncbi:hypothetical protein AAMO2058_000575000 [Amorphochlora amoebiformis]